MQSLRGVLRPLKWSLCFLLMMGGMSSCALKMQNAITQPSVNSVLITNVSPTNSVTFNLDYARIFSNYRHFCILENNINVSSCSWESGPVPESYTVSAVDGEKTLSIWLKNSEGRVGSRVDAPPVVLDLTPPSLASATVSNSNPTNTLIFNLSVGVITDTYIRYCILENSTMVGSCSWTAGSLPENFTVSSTENSKVLSLWLQDSVGNISARVDTASVTLDTTAPILASASVTNSSPTNSPSFGLSYGAITGTYASYCILENSTTLGSCSWTAGSLPANFTVSSTENSKVLSLWLQDAAGNISARVDTASVTLDTTAPILASASITNSSPTNSPSFGLSYGAITGTYESYCILENSTTFEGCTWTPGVLPPDYLVTSGDGAGVLSLWLQDSAGNISARVDTASVTLDTTAPILASASVTNSSPTNSPSFGLSYGAITGTYESYCILENSTTLGSCSWTAGSLPENFTVSSSENSKVLSLWLQDSAGNISARVDTASVTLDTTAPTVAITSPALGSSVLPASFSSWTVSGTCSEDGATVSLSGAVTTTATCSSGSWSKTLDLSALSTGAFTLAVDLADAAGNAAPQGSSSFTKAPAGPSLASAAVTNTRPSFSRIFGLSYGAVTGEYSSYCILENSTTVENCTWTVGALPASFQVSATEGSKVLSIWLKDDSGNVSPRVDTASVRYLAYLVKTTLAAGTSGHACAIDGNGTVKCWGSNSSGALGDGTTTSSSTPVTVTGLTGAVAISATGPIRPSSCAVLSDGTARCWGNNTSGKLGNGTTTASSIPVTVSGLTGAVAIAVGANHACALLSDGTGRCWGSGSGGLLGNGATANSSTPVTVSGLSGAVAVGAGSSHTCALISDGTVKCWGQGSSGQLGNGATANSSTPVTVSGVTGAVAISAGAGGASHSCALINDGTVKCWGINASGQLGDGTTTNSSTPVTVSGLTGAVAVTASPSHSCALIGDGTVKCWGSNSTGRLGDGTTTNRLTPVTVLGLTGAVEIAVGSTASFAVLEDGTVRSWGSGPLGFDAMTSSFTPVTVSGLSGGVAIASGLHNCALLGDGTVKCWGRGTVGQLGNGSTSSSATPVAVSGLAGVVAIGASPADSPHSCAVLEDGSVKCWGTNSAGQLGDGTTTSSLAPVTVSGLTGAVSIALGGEHSCALLGDGTIKCWGLGTNGQLGNGGTTSSSTPVTVSGLTGAVRISAGLYFSCALLADGTVRCWGSNSYGELGNGTTTASSTPVTVSGLTGVVAINSGSGQYHSCAALGDGTVKCWGLGSSGQLGNGATANSSTPVTVSGLSGTFTIFAIYARSCAAFGDGTMKCWGGNSTGQLGDGTTTNSSTPVTVAGLTGAVSLAGGSSHTCAILGDGSGKCWGSGSEGALGILIPLLLSTGIGQVANFDRDLSSPVTSISGTSPVLADGVASSTISIQLTHGSGSPWVGVTPTFAANDGGGRNIAGDCSVSDALGQSTCLLKSTYADVKRLWLMSPIQIPASSPGSGSITFTAGSAAKFTLSGPSSVKQNVCSSRPFVISLTDSQGNPVVASATITPILSGLGSSTLYSDPQCGSAISSTFSFAAGTSSAVFYIKDTVAENLSLSVSDGTFSTSGAFSLGVTSP